MPNPQIYLTFIPTVRKTFRVYHKLGSDAPLPVSALTFQGSLSPLLDRDSCNCSTLHCMSMSESKCVCVSVAAGNPITALMYKREEEEAVVRKRNAELQFLFSPVMGRRLAGLTECLM